MRTFFVLFVLGVGAFLLTRSSPGNAGTLQAIGDTEFVADPMADGDDACSCQPLRCDGRVLDAGCAVSCESPKKARCLCGKCEYGAFNRCMCTGG